MNALFARGGFPTLSIEIDSDWKDRVAATATTEKGRAWRFDRVLLADRSAAHRGRECGSRTQRTAAEAVWAVVPKDRDGKPAPGHEFLERGWWEPVRRRVLKFVGVPQSQIDLYNSDEPERVLPSEKIVVTYIERQSVRRHLIREDHELLVKSLREMCQRRGWELVIMKGEALSKDQQLQIASKTTVRTCICYFATVILPLSAVSRRRSWQRLVALDHDAADTSGDRHRIILPHRLRARLRMDRALFGDETLCRME